MVPSHPVEASVCVVCQEVMEAKEDIRVFGGPDVEAQRMKEERLMADVGSEMQEAALAVTGMCS